ncbi:MAG: tetratricopeptide repeat protein [Gaiellales bacterium]
MNNQSTLVKVIIWLMVFLMSVGFVGLVIAPFMGNTNLFGDGTGRGATEKLVAEARADIAKDNCDATGKDKPTGKRLERCEDALSRLASSYMTLATPPDGTEEYPRDAQRNFDRSGEAWKALYTLNPSNDDNAARYAGWMRDAGDSEGALNLWDKLVKKNPEDEDFILQKAGAQVQAQDIDAAVATYRLYIKRFPDSGQIDSIKDEIKNLIAQQKEQAAGGGAGDAPITVQ